MIILKIIEMIYFMKTKVIKFIRKKRFTDNIFGWSFVLPALLFFGIFLVSPIFSVIKLSFYSWEGFGDMKFVGLNNYIKMFTRDINFWTAVKNTLIFMFGATICNTIVGFSLAMAIDLRVRFWKIYRAVFFLAYVVSVYVVSLLWKQVFDKYGLLNQLLGLLNLEVLQRSWFLDPNMAMGLIIFITFWQVSGFHMIFYLAGMATIPEELYEAAVIDGANTLQRIIKITIPMLKNVFAVLVTMTFIYTFKIFVRVFVITGGAPAGKTEVMGTLLFRYAFVENQFGYASVIAVVTIIIAAIFGIFYIRIRGYK